MCTTLRCHFWLLICIQYWTAIYCATSQISCALCPVARSHRDQKGYLSLKGCNQEDVLPLREKCSLCAISIVADVPWISEVVSDEDPDDVLLYQIPEGTILSKGCSLQNATKTGTCEYTGRLYVCYCDKNLCNLVPPSCEVMGKAGRKSGDPKGCSRKLDEKPVARSPKKPSVIQKAEEEGQGPETTSPAEPSVTEQAEDKGPEQDASGEASIT